MASGPTTICFDFDGVIHSYTSPFDLTNITDPPNQDVVELINKLRANNYEIVVCSSRCATEEGIQALKDYLNKHNIIVDRISKEKPIAFAYVDDRAICYKPKQSPEEIDAFYNEIINFKTWSGR